MKWFLRAASVVIAGLLAVVALSSATASADPLAGKTYAQAVATIASWGKGTSKPIIATVNGSRMATDQCIVTSWHKGIFTGATGGNRGGEVYLNLDCNQSLASPGHPGSSAVSPQGRQAKEDNANAEYIAGHPEACEKNANTAKWCADLCTKTGLCEVGS